MQELEYPFDVDNLLKNQKRIKRELLEKEGLLEKRIAILGGSTTDMVKKMMELFLLNNGIKPIFYESEYNKYYEDAMFGNTELNSFNPDIIYIHTSSINLLNLPIPSDSKEEVSDKLNSEYLRYESMWKKLGEKYNAIIIQNNFELPNIRLLGNKDAVDYRGRINFIDKLNQKFYEYAEINNKTFYINDINYVSACFGLDSWHNELFYYMYKYAMDMKAIPYLSFNIANIIKAIYGKNKKALVLDMDNTLWGGIIGDDGVDGITIGSETALGEAYQEFQKYLKSLKGLGIILNVNSKNDYDNAIAGLNHPSGILKKEDFIIIKANWEPKNLNIKNIAYELNLGEDSFVFVDDNPAERTIVKQYNEAVSTPVINNNEPDKYIKILDRNGYFEVLNLTEEDLKKNDLYKDNAKRSEMMSNFEEYDDYLRSLKMTAEIKPFKDVYLERISQLSNKSNQFNLTTHRYSIADIESIHKDDNYIKLYGKLIDIFGDNGVISVVIGNIKEKDLHIDLWIMSCRVLKRNMEFAMMDELVRKCKEKNINTIYGYYYPTLKNKMVSDFYDIMGFELINTDSDNNKTYKLDVNKYENKNNIIEVENE